MLVFQPGSWKALAGVNVLLDESLYDRFVRDELESQGVVVDHRRDLAVMKLPDNGPELWIARIADTVLVSTEERQLARIRNWVEKNGLPEEPASRYLALRDPIGDFEAHFLVRRKKADQGLKLEETLLEQWGRGNLDLAESLFPRLAGDDIIVELKLGRGVGTAIQGRSDPP